MNSKCNVKIPYPILYRGQTRRKGEKVRMDGEKVPGNWVQGAVFPGTGDFSIIYDLETLNKFSVYSDTVDPYTGMDDIKGTKIFGKDIVMAECGNYGTKTGLVVWNPKELAYQLFCDKANIRIPLASAKNIVVIGNQHDDPDLI